MTGGISLRDLKERRVTDLKPVGPKLATGLAEMGIASVLDLLQHGPHSIAQSLLLFR